MDKSRSKRGATARFSTALARRLDRVGVFHSVNWLLSEFTRAEILRLSDYPVERIRVVPLAVSAEFFEPISKLEIDALCAQHQLGEHKIILHVGSCAPRKNVELILCAMNALRDLDVMFVQVGGQFAPTQVELIASLGVRERVLQLPATFGHPLSVWYHAADVFVFPSHYEGFGMPVLEAMAANVPTICSHASSLPEVAGDAAILIDPREARSLAVAIRGVLIDSARADNFRARGRQRARSFSWEQTARATLAAYEQVV